MPDVQIDGTNTTLSFPDSMSQAQIGQVMATHPLVQQLHGQAQHDSLIAPRQNDPAFENNANTFTQQYLQPGDQSAPSLMAQRLSQMPAYQRPALLSGYSNDVSRSAVLRKAYSLSDPLNNAPPQNAGARVQAMAAVQGIPSAPGITPGGKPGIVPANTAQGQSAAAYQAQQNRNRQAQVDAEQQRQAALSRQQWTAQEHQRAANYGTTGQPPAQRRQAAQQAGQQAQAAQQQIQASQAKVQALGGDQTDAGRMAYGAAGRLINRVLLGGGGVGQDAGSLTEQLTQHPGSALDALVPGTDAVLKEGTPDTSSVTGKIVNNSVYKGVAPVAAAGLEPSSVGTMLAAGPVGELAGVPKLLHAYFMGQAAIGTAKAAADTDLYNKDKGQYFGALMANAAQLGAPLLLKAATDEGTARQFAKSFNDNGGEIHVPDIKQANLAYRGLKRGGQSALIQKLPDNAGYRLYAAKPSAATDSAPAPSAQPSATPTPAQPAQPNVAPQPVSAPTSTDTQAQAQPNGAASQSPVVASTDTQGQAQPTNSPDTSAAPLNRPQNAPAAPPSGNAGQFTPTHEIVTRGERVPVRVVQDSGGPIVKVERENGQTLTPTRGQLQPIQADAPTSNPVTPDAQNAPQAASAASSVPSAPPAVVSGQGRTGTAYTADNTAVPFRYELREAKDLIASHTDTMQPNPRYDQSLQPRDRSRLASEAQVSDIATKLNPPRLGVSASTADGAPLIGPDNMVESGNGRTLGLLRAYDRNLPGADAYRQFLKTSAGEYGLDPTQVDSMQRPVLVRVRTNSLTPEQRSAFADEAGKSGVSGMSDVETAKGDAQKLRASGLLGQFVGDEGGNIASRDNLPFVRGYLEQLPVAERNSLIQSDGTLSATGVRRIRAGVLASAYDDTPALQRLLEDPDQNTRNVGNAMLNSAPKFAALKEAAAQGTRYPLDITGDITQAANKLSALRDQGQSVETYRAQQGMFGQELSPVATELLSVMDRYKRSGAKLGKVLDTYADLAHAAGDPHQQSLFDGETPTPLETLHSALKLNGDNNVTVTADQAAAYAAERARSNQPGAGEARPQRAENDATLPGEVRTGQPVQSQQSAGTAGTSPGTAGTSPGTDTRAATPSTSVPVAASDPAASVSPHSAAEERAPVSTPAAPNPAETNAGAQERPSAQSALPGLETQRPATLDLSKARSPRDVKQQITQTVQTPEAGRFPATPADTVQAARDLGLNAAQLRKVTPAGAAPADYARAVRTTLEAHGEDVKQAAQAYQDAPTPDNLTRLERARQGYQTVLLTATGRATEASKALQQFRLLDAAGNGTADSANASPADVFPPASAPAPADANPNVKPQSRTFGADNTLFTAERANAAKARIQDKLTRLNSGVDPSLIPDLLEVGGHYLEGGIREFGKWANAMRENVSDKLDDATLQHVWANLRAEAQSRQQTRATSDVFVDKLAGRLGRQGAAEFVNALQGQDGNTDTLSALLTGKPLSTEQQATVANAYLDNLPNRTKTGAAQTGPMQTLSDVVAKARQDGRSAAQANKPPLSDAQLFTRYVTRSLGKAGADQFLQNVPADAIQSLLDGKPLDQASAQAVAKAFTDAQKPRVAPFQLAGASRALADVVKDARTQAKQQGQSAQSGQPGQDAQTAQNATGQAAGGAGGANASQSPQAPPSAKQAVQSRLSTLDPDTAQRMAADLANLRPDDYAGMNALVRRYSSMSPLDKVSTLRKAGLLSGIRTVGKIGVAHATYLAAEEASRLPASLADILLSAMTGNDRQIQGVSVGAMAQAAKVAATRGLQEAKTIFKGGEGSLALQHMEHGTNDAYTQMGGSFDNAPAEFSSGNRLLDGYVNGVFRAHGGMYQIMRTYALTRALMEQADLGARSEATHMQQAGQSVPADYIANRRAQLLQNPSDTMTATAIHAAEEATFLNNNLAASMVSGARQATQKYGNTGAAARFAMDMAVPFPKVPSNVVARLIDYTGASAGLESVKAAKSVLSKAGISPEQQTRMAQTFGRGSVGAGVIALGYLLASKGQATGTLENAEERKKNETEGVKPGALMVNGKWRQTDDISPVGALFSSGASLYQMGQSQQAQQAKLDEKGSTKQARPRVGEALFHLLHEQPLVSGVSNVSDLMEGKQYALGGVAGSFVPTLASDLAGQLDPLVRQKDGWQDYVKNRVPGMRQSLPAKVDENGQGIPQGNPLYDFLNSRDPKNLPLSTEEAQKVADREQQKEDAKGSKGGRSMFGASGSTRSGSSARGGSLFRPRR